MKNEAGPLTDRDQFLDYLKGLLIFVVTYGHAIQFVGYHDEGFWNDPAFKTIYMFHMPLFIGISGYLSYGSIQKTRLGSLLLRRAWNLLVPIFSWALLGMIVIMVQSHAHTPGSMAAAFFGQVSGLWFLWALFASIVIVAALHSLGYDAWQWLAVASLATLALPDSVYVIKLFKFSFPFFCLGYLLFPRRNDPAARVAWSSIGLVIVAIAVFVLCFRAWRSITYVYLSGMSLRRGVPRWIFLRDVAAVATSYLFIRLSQVLLRARWATNSVCRLGRHSLNVYLLQCFALTALMGLPHSFGGTVIFNLTITPLIAACFAMFCLAVGLVIEQSPLAGTLLFGRINRQDRRERVLVSEGAVPAGK